MSTSRPALAARLADIWSEVLGVAVTDTDTLVEHGGSSLHALQICGRVESEFATSVPLLALFELSFAQYAALVADTHTTTPRRIPARDTLDAPLSRAQRRLNFVEALTPDTPDYHVPLAYRIRGPLDTAALTTAVTELLRRHPVLRVTLVDCDSAEPRQHPTTTIAPLRLERVTAAEVTALAAAEAHTRFDLTAGPLIRVRVLASDTEHILLLTMHHLITDRRSNQLLLHELSTLYDTAHQGRTPPESLERVDYLDYSAWEQDTTSDTIPLFWSALFPEGLTPFTLTTPHDPTAPGGRVRVELPDTVTTALTRLARTNRATLFMVLLACWQTLLVRMTGQHRGFITMPASTRTLPELHDTIGLFVNPVLMPVTITGNPTFRELLATVRDTATTVYAHADTAIDDVLAVLAPHRDRSHDPLAAVKFTLEEGSLTPTLTGCEITPLETPTDIERFDLGVDIEHTDNRLTVAMAWRAGRYHPRTITPIINYYLRLLTAVAAQPDTPVFRHDLTSPEQQRILLRSGTGAAHPIPAPVPELVRHISHHHPDATAVTNERYHWTYADLDQLADRVATWLTQARVRPGDRVAVTVTAA